jgi:hypothetical protein
MAELTQAKHNVRGTIGREINMPTVARRHFMPWLASILALLAACVTALPADATDQGPSKEKCTCAFTEPERKATADNAALCVQHTGPGFCTIFIEVLENDPKELRDFVVSLEAAVGPNDQLTTAKLGTAISTILNKYQAAHPEDKNLSADITVIEMKLIPQYGKIIQQCVSDFLKRSPMFIDEGALRCSVGKETGWLDLGFTVNDRGYSIKVKPG